MENTIFEELITNNLLLFVTVMFIGLVLLALYPILYLKYCKDLYENINIFNDICYDNSISIQYNSNIPIKNTFIWKISNILFDFNKIDKNFKKLKEVDGINIKYSINDKDTDFRRLSKHSNNNELLIIYDKYVKYSVPLILFIIILFLIHCFFNYNYNKFSINDNGLVIYIFIYLLMNLVFFSTILTIIMDLYINTNAYNYIMLLKELDIILKTELKTESKTESKTDPKTELTTVSKTDPKTYSNRKIIEILKKYSNDENINIEEVVLNNSLIDELINLKDNYLITTTDNVNITLKIIHTNCEINITLANIDKMKIYTSNESNKKIFKEIDKISRFILAYIFLLIPLLYIISILLKKIYIFCLFFIIGMLLCIISIYNMYYIIL